VARVALLIGLVVALTSATVVVSAQAPSARSSSGTSPRTSPAALASLTALDRARLRLQDDEAAMGTFRPSYPFWRHVFTVPDGNVVFGTATDGALIATFRDRSDWVTDGTWTDPTLARWLSGGPLPGNVSERRDEVVRRLTPVLGTIVHNPTRGLFLLPNALRYGSFLGEWSAIYERFAVPADIGLAQAVVESGLSGTVRSEARAVGFCQWLDRNWKRLQKLAPHPIESANQTTQAAYCAAYLTVLGTKYGSFIPALSEHHAGGANIGRALINGERLGGLDVRQQYFLGSDFARDLRVLSPGTFSDVYGTYGPRSFRYAEMIFGNTANVRSIAASTPQRTIVAIRTSRALTLAEVARAAKISTDEVRRYNPALVKRVPRGAALYLPTYVRALGTDVTFWHRPAPRAFATTLDEFTALNVSPVEWESRRFDAVLQEFRRRFLASGCEEGTVMATMLAYVMQERGAGGQGALLAEFRSSDEILRLFAQAQLERGLHALSALPIVDGASLEALELQEQSESELPTSPDQ